MSIQTASIEFGMEDGKYIAFVTTPHGITRIPLSAVLSFSQTYTGDYVPKIQDKPKKVTAKRQKKASMKQETKIMESLGGRRQTGSGAVGHLKGDGRVRNKYRVEIKYTRTKSYRVDRDELSKIRGECADTEQPLFVIDFVDKETGGSEDRWVLVPFPLFKKLDNAAGDNR